MLRDAFFSTFCLFAATQCDYASTDKMKQLLDVGVEIIRKSLFALAARYKEFAPIYEIIQGYKNLHGKAMKEWFLAHGSFYIQKRHKRFIRTGKGERSDNKQSNS